MIEYEYSKLQTMHKIISRTHSTFQSPYDKKICLDATLKELFNGL